MRNVSNDQWQALPDYGFETVDDVHTDYRHKIGVVWLDIGTYELQGVIVGAYDDAGLLEEAANWAVDNMPRALSVEDELDSDEKEDYISVDGGQYLGPNTDISFPTHHQLILLRDRLADRYRAALNI